MGTVTDELSSLDRTSRETFFGEMTRWFPDETIAPPQGAPVAVESLTCYDIGRSAGLPTFRVEVT